MDEAIKILAFLQSPSVAIILAALLAASEILASIPRVKANSIFQLLVTLLEKFAPKSTK